MESGLLSLSKLFTERLLRIPDYQRGFSWKQKQLKEFWSDLEQLEGDRQHYLGVLTLEPVDEKVTKRWVDDRWLIDSKSFVPYHVVDGQQRLTTIVILLQCVFEQLRADERLNYSSRDEIQAKYIFIHKEGSDGSFLFGYEKDNPSYECLKTKILKRHSSRYSAGESTIYTKNLLVAKEFFQEKIAKLDRKELEGLFAKVTQHLLFNVFNIEKEVDVHVAFETMNNRGLQLSNLELLKNRLIYLTTRLSEAPSNIESLRRTINDSWKTVYYYLGKSPKVTLSDDFFLQVHFLIYFAKQLLEQHPKLFEISFNHGVNHLYKTFLLDETFTLRRLQAKSDEERIGSTALYKYAIDLKTVVENYYYLNFPDDSTFSPEEKLWLSRLKRLRQTSQTHEIIVQLLLLYLQHKPADRITVLKMLEKYFFVRSILPYRFRKKVWTLDIGRELLECASRHMTIVELVRRIDSQLKAAWGDPNFCDAVLEGLTERGYYDWQDLRYFMYEYELHLKTKARRKSDKIDWDMFVADNEEDHASIEHILPQTAKDAYWKERLEGYSPSQIKKLTNSLGNLVATSAPRNSSLQNRPFPEKARGADKKTCYRFGSYSEIEVAQQEHWGPEQILHRGMVLLDFMSERWGIRMTSEKSKKKGLGLDFMS